MKLRKKSYAKSIAKLTAEVGEIEKPVHMVMIVYQRRLDTL